MKIYFHQILLGATSWQVNAFLNQFVIVRVAGDQRFIVRKRHSWNRLLLLLIKFHLKPTATFLRKQLTALDMVLNTPLSHKLSTYYYNADVCKDPNDYRNSSPEVFCKKDVLKNFAKFAGKRLCRVSFLIKLQACGRVSFLVKMQACARVSFLIKLQACKFIL